MKKVVRWEGVGGGWRLYTDRQMTKLELSKICEYTQKDQEAKLAKLLPGPDRSGLKLALDALKKTGVSQLVVDARVLGALLEEEERKATTP